MERLAYRIGEAADVLGISRSKAYELVAAGQLPVLRVGQSMRIPADGLRAWVQRQTQENAAL